jgi:TRAP-type C4-dicarboxylate transport system permease small subunit
LETIDNAPEKGANKIFVWMNRGEDALLVTCLVVMVVLAFFNIIARNFGGGGIAWADKVLINLVLWVAMLGGAIASKSNDHIKIDIVSPFVPAQYHKYFNVFTQFFAGIVTAILCYEAYQLVATIEYPEHREFIPHIQTWMPMAIMPFGFALMSIRFFRFSIEAGIKIFKGRDAI